MSFTQFKNIGEVLKKYQLKVKRSQFLQTLPLHTAPDSLKLDIQFSLKQGLYKHSEAAICEQLIHPVLRTLWKEHFVAEMLLWSHTQFSVNEILTGVPDYIFTQRTDYDSEVLEAPILFAVEAKKDNFEEAWGQCAAEMVAAQKANDTVLVPVYGCVTNGKIWEFAQLKATSFIKDPDYFDILELDKLYSALYAILYDCKKQFALS